MWSWLMSRLAVADDVIEHTKMEKLLVEDVDMIELTKAKRQSVEVVDDMSELAKAEKQSVLVNKVRACVCQDRIQSHEIG